MNWRDWFCRWFGHRVQRFPNTLHSALCTRCGAKFWLNSEERDYFGDKSPGLPHT